MNMNDADITKASNEAKRLCHELDITNADHISLWLEHNAFDSTLGWLACRIIEAHKQEMALAGLRYEAHATDRETYLSGYRAGFYAAGNYFPDESWARYLRERKSCA